MVDGYLVEEGLVEGGVLPLQLVDLLVELGLYVGALHLEVLQGVYAPLHHLGKAGERWGFIRVMWTEGGQSMRGATSSPLPVFRCTEQLPCDRQRRRRVCTSSTGTSPCACTLVILVPLHVSRGRPHQAVCSGYTGVTGTSPCIRRATPPGCVCTGYTGTSPCILRATPPGCVCTGYTGVTGTSPSIRRGTPPGCVYWLYWCYWYLSMYPEGDPTRLCVYWLYWYLSMYPEGDPTRLCVYWLYWCYWYLSMYPEGDPTRPSSLSCSAARISGFCIIWTVSWRAATQSRTQGTVTSLDQSEPIITSLGQSQSTGRQWASQRAQAVTGPIREHRYFTEPIRGHRHSTEPIRAPSLH